MKPQDYGVRSAVCQHGTVSMVVWDCYNHHSFVGLKWRGYHHAEFLGPSLTELFALWLARYVAVEQPSQGQGLSQPVTAHRGWLLRRG
ncbi:hypothetical protein V2G26_020312 [Clonostachys chloroleuca]